MVGCRQRHGQFQNTLLYFQSSYFLFLQLHSLPGPGVNLVLFAYQFVSMGSKDTS